MSCRGTLVQDRCPLIYSCLLLHRAELAQRSLSKGCRWYSTFCHHQQVGARSPRGSVWAASAAATAGAVGSVCQGAHIWIQG